MSSIPPTSIAREGNAPRSTRVRRWLAMALALHVVSALCAGATCQAPAGNAIVVLPASSMTMRLELAPGDVIEVRVFGEPELSAVHEVSSNGTIRLPLVGLVEATGRTTDELAAQVAALYNQQYLRGAEVTVSVRDARSRKVYVLGQVARPGPVRIDGHMTVIEAIALAGGTTKLADPNRTLLTREAEGSPVRVVVAVDQIGTGAAPDVVLQPGDILFVPESPF